MDLISEFQRRLERYLPGARLAYLELPNCGGLELLLIEEGFDDSQLTREQIELLSDDPPYWIFCWASGRAVAKAIMSGKVAVRDKVVLDFGAGCGVVAIAAKMAGAKRVYACDIDMDCCELTALNAGRNGVEIDIVTDALEIMDEVHLVLAADVLYEAKNLALLDLLPRLGAEVIVADSRLKRMPDERYQHIDTVTTSSFPDYNEALANNEVKFYRADGVLED